MPITATALRTDIYRILDEALATGEPVEIIRGERTLTITADGPPPRSRLDRVHTQPEALNVDPEELVHLDWSDQWRP